MLSAFIEKHRLHHAFSQTATEVYIPLAKRLLNESQQSSSPFFVGINGCQGSGKSTMAAFLSDYLASEYKLNVLVMSLDDFYLSTDARDKLAQQVHPLLATRGVPGTHDIALLSHVLSQLKQGDCEIAIPRFNKAIDEPYPCDAWQKIAKPVDIVLLEGWCWGVMPQIKAQLALPVNELESMRDNKGEWRSYVNQQLIEHYVPLYAYMNYWLVLQAPSFGCVFQWRLEQEKKLTEKVSSLSGLKLMSSDQVLSFIQYFQRLTNHAINTLSQSADVIMFLDEKRIITNVVYKEK